MLRMSLTSLATSARERALNGQKTVHRQATVLAIGFPRTRRQHRSLAAVLVLPRPPSRRPAHIPSSATPSSVHCPPPGADDVGTSAGAGAGAGGDGRLSRRACTEVAARRIVARRRTGEDAMAFVLAIVAAGTLDASSSTCFEMCCCCCCGGSVCKPAGRIYRGGLSLTSVDRVVGFREVISACLRTDYRVMPPWIASTKYV
jgi:hypothetical protein